MTNNVEKNDLLEYIESLGNAWSVLIKSAANQFLDQKEKDVRELIIDKFKMLIYGEITKLEQPDEIVIDGVGETTIIESDGDIEITRQYLIKGTHIDTATNQLEKLGLDLRIVGEQSSGFVPVQITWTSAHSRAQV